MVRATRSGIKQETPNHESPLMSTDQSSSASMNLGTDTMNGESNTTIRTNQSAEMTPSAMETLGSHSRDLIQVIQKLDALCINSTLPSLPKFVVVGDQSAGKSSVIEAICDISLPRSQGTCTKCPFQITTKEGVNWSCKVTLHRKYAYTPNLKAGKDATKYDRWTEQDSLNQFEFATVYDKGKLEEVLWRAQLAILNPQRDPNDFVRVQLPGAKSQVGFSPNIVSIHITGRGLPELSFFDLPGAINVHEDASEQYLVSFIERLTKNYLRDEKALTLLAVACDQDTENSTAFRFVGQCKALGRCMGVLTKPDLLALNRQEHVKRLVNSEIFKLGKGWIVTKSLSQSELDDKVTHAEARKREHNFFANGEPWCSTLSSFADRFGIPRLQDAISQELTKHIVNDLPEIMSRVETRLIEVVRRLESLPERAKAPAYVVMNEVEKMSRVVVEELRGDGLENDFRNQYKASIRKLREQLKHARPCLILATPGFQPPTIDVSDDETPSPRPTPSKARKGLDGRAIKSEDTRDATMPSPKKPITLKDVRKSYERGSSSGFPDQINPKVTERIILDSLRGWHDVFSASLQEIQVLLQSVLLQRVNLCLASRSQTMLCQEANRIVDTLFMEIASQQRQVISNVVACETHKPITYANSLLKHNREAAMAELRSKRYEVWSNEIFDTQDARTSKTTKPEDRKRKMNDAAWVEANLKNDPYARELEAMAIPLAYYDIASARVVDIFANHLEFGMIYKLEEQLKEALLEGLDVTNSEYCAKLLADEPEREAERHRLVAEKTKLEQALKELQSLAVRN